ncbi:DUF4149 domain-containing protein [Massilia solisilvae]|uniref:DUF4149 domain-containing protein n=1 Tax=Massilia solisilvae TaxID=1811225 RepID=A0ABT2BMH0_9BURK|nr:DUF4149 domain-containing protein [Massilia solisilvae]MCS0609063.1 DUF4149 domain-containing protein [Massilia solisilvae]
MERAAVLRGARLLVAVLWAGSLWALGYVAAPTVFRMLPSTQAGEIVGALLERQAWLAMACALVLLVLARFAQDLDAKRKRALVIVVVVMLACALVIYLGLQPAMARMREAAGPAGVRASPYWTQFAAMHGVSQVLHMVESLLGAVLVLKSR